MSDEAEGGEGGEGGGSSGDALAAFVAEEAPEAKAEPKAEAAPEKKPESKPEPKAEAKDAKPPEKKDPPLEKKKYRVKIRDEESEVDEDELVRGYQRARDVTKKAQDLAQERKGFEEARALAKSDPVKALRLLGLDEAEIKEKIGKAAYTFFADEVDPKTGEPLTEEQKRLQAAERKLAEVDAEKKAAADKQAETERAQAREQAEKHWVKTIVAHLEKSGAPKHILPRVAQYLSDSIEADQSLDPADLIDDATKQAWEDVEAEHKHLLSGMEFSAIKAKFPELVEKVRAGFVAEFKAKRGAPKPVVVEVAPEEKERRQRQAARPTTTRDALRQFVHG